MSTALLTADSKTKLTGTSKKLETWWEHFIQVCNVPSVVVEWVLDDVRLGVGEVDD